MYTKPSLLVKDNPDDEALTLSAPKKQLLRTGAHTHRHLRLMPQVVLRNLKLPRIDGSEVLRGLRANAQTRSLPLVILTSSKEDQDRVSSYALGANHQVRKPVDFAEFLEAVRLLGLYWLILNVEPLSEIRKVLSADVGRGSEDSVTVPIVGKRGRKNLGRIVLPQRGGVPFCTANEALAI